MNRFADYAARFIATTLAVGITALTIFIHAADRTQLGAPSATAADAPHPAAVVAANAQH